MALPKFLTQSTVAKYARSIRQAPPEIIYNKHLLLSAAMYACASVPLTWDQGSASVIPELPGFQEHFGFSNSDAGDMQYYVSIVYIGAAAGALASLFINDRLGRLWSWRLYVAIYMIGQLVACLTPTLAGLYASRIVVGISIGSLSVVGTMAIVEIAPTEIRGLLAVWYSVAMTMASVCSVFCVYGSYLNIEPSRLQYQVVYFSPIVFFVFLLTASFFLCESPRWQWITGQHDEAIATLVKLRGLPANHPRVQEELLAIQESVQKETESVGDGSSKTLSIIKEMVTIPANLRRLQQSVLSYALAQLSGANVITSYFIPILTLLGNAGGPAHSLFLSGMYSFSKLCFTLIASFFFVDALGRRGSLFVGAFLQMISDIYLGVYLKYEQAGQTNDASGEAALAALFVHAFGYAVGLFILPYVFGGELFPNRLRSFGGAISQCFHWLFFFAMTFGTPSLLDSTHNWGAFLFFASWCLVALIYVFFTVPEIAGLSVEELDSVFEGPWYKAYLVSRKGPALVPTDALEQTISYENEVGK